MTTQATIYSCICLLRVLFSICICFYGVYDTTLPGFSSTIHSQIKFIVIHPLFDVKPEIDLNNLYSFMYNIFDFVSARAQVFYFRFNLHSIYLALCMRLVLKLPMVKMHPKMPRKWYSKQQFCGFSSSIVEIDEDESKTNRNKIQDNKHFSNFKSIMIRSF